MLYRLLTGVHSRIEGKDNDGNPIRKKYHPTQLIDLNRTQAEALGARVVPHVPHVDDPVDDAEVLAAAEETTTLDAPGEEGDGAPMEPEPTDPTDAWEGVTEMTVPEVDDLVASVEDEADLRAIFQVETDGKGRQGVFNAVRFRLAALAEAADEAAADEADEATATEDSGTEEVE